MRAKQGDGESTRVRFVGKGGRVLSEQDGPEACYRAEGGELYIRAVVESSVGGRAWTQAEFLDDTPSIM